MGVVVGRLGELWVQTGSATSFTTEACTQIGATTTYKITSASKRQWDSATTVSVFEDGASATTPYTVQYPIGRIVFASAPTTPVTVTGEYYDTVQVAYATGWKLDLKTGVFETTALGDTTRSFMATGLVDWSGSFERFYEDDTWAALVAAGSTPIFKFYEDAPSDRVWIGYGAISDWGVTVDVGELIKENVSYSGKGDIFYIDSEA